jgi:hypothetical protein
MRVSKEGGRSILKPDISKLLVCVKSCERDALNGANQAIRETWSRDWLDIFFFVGTGKEHLQGDEFRVDAPDDYEGLPFKTKQIAKYAVLRQYDFAFILDTDTFVDTERMILCGFQKFDYVGLFGEGYNSEGHFDHKISGPWDRKAPDLMMRDVYPWASGGHGYFLSRQALKLVASTEPMHWAEDFCVGQILGPAIEAGLLTSYNHPRFNGYVVDHFSGTGQGKQYDPQWMRDRYREGLP